MNWKDHPWAGVFPATLCAFRQDESLDEEGLFGYLLEIAQTDGVQGLVCNGHTGEIMALRIDERARVTRLAAAAASQSGRDVKVVSGVAAEGSLAAIDQAQAAAESGADAVLLMPPHHWLRFGRSSDEAVGFIQDVADGAGVSIIVHQYPAWTKAGYTLDEMLHMVRIPQVVAIKMGTRDMARWRYDYQRLKAAAPHVTILTCHDEFLLPTLLEGADGALVGFAGFVPELIVRLVQAALDGDLASARQVQAIVAPLAQLIYQFGEPGGAAHQRMKTARWLLGRFPSPHVRRPLRPLEPGAVEQIRQTLKALGMTPIR